MPANKPQPTTGENFLLTRLELEALLLVAFRKLDEISQRNVLGMVENWAAVRTARN